jgi:hypothetical protein
VSHLFFGVARMDEVAGLLDQFHYIGARCADPCYVFAMRKAGGLFGDQGEPVCAAVFAPSAARAWGSESIELVRLVRAENINYPLSSFIAKCAREIERRKRFSLLVSYADPAAGHHGGIYQASNWIYVGQSSSKARYINKSADLVMSQRCFDQSKNIVGEHWERERTGKKNTYVLPLNRRERKRWEPRRLAYPKPNPEVRK